jgi:hypothetical protein
MTSSQRLLRAVAALGAYEATESSNNPFSVIASSSVGGFYGVAYQVGDTVVIAYRGTNLSSLAVRWPSLFEQLSAGL